MRRRIAFTILAGAMMLVCLSGMAERSPQVRGGFTSVTIITNNYTIETGINLILADATSGPITVTLPDAVTNNGMSNAVVKIDSSANAVTVDGAGAQTINGSATHSLPTQWDYVVVTSDGSNWYIIASPGLAGVTDHGSLAGLADDDHLQYLRIPEILGTANQIIVTDNGDGTITISAALNKDIAAGTGITVTGGDDTLIGADSDVTIAVDESAINAQRSVTFVVAANDSTALGKSHADYTCDGTADEAEINTAIDALPATGGRVLLLEGTYYINSSITIDNAASNDYVTLEGQGMGTILTIPNGHGSIMDMIDCNGAVTGIKIKDMRIDGNRSGVPGAGNWYVGISFDTVTDSSIENVFASNGKGVGGDGYAYHIIDSSDIIISNCTGEDWDFEPLEFRNSNEVIVTDCTFESSIELYDNCDYVSFTDNVFIDMMLYVGTDLGGADYCDHINIADNEFYTTLAGGSEWGNIWLIKAYKAQITGNVFYINGANCIGVTTDAGDNHLIANNNFYLGASAVDAIKGDFDYTHIVGNRIYHDEANYAITIENGGEYNNIIGNYSYNTDYTSYDTILVDLQSGANNNVIQANYAYDGGDVIQVASDGNVIAENHIRGGYDRGLDITGDNNLLYDNDISGTAVVANIVDAGSGNKRSTNFEDFDGTTVFSPSSTQAITAVGDSISADASLVVLNPDGDYTLTSTPTIADGVTGQILVIMCANAEANTVTVQDQDTLAGSNLELGDTTRAITGKTSVILVFDGADWIESSYGGADALQAQKDLVSGAGLTGGEDNVLFGADSDTTLAVGAGDNVIVNADEIEVYGLVASDGDPTDALVANGDGDLTANYDITIDGTTVFNPSATQAITAVGDSITANATVVVLNPDADYTLTSTPTIANGTTGQLLYITAGNGEANTVTLQDESELAGSNLRLKGETTTVSGQEVISLVFDGTEWIEYGAQDIIRINKLTVINQLNIPYGTNPTTDAPGEIAIDTDDGAIEVYDDELSVSILNSHIKYFSATIFDPDSIQSTEDAVPILPVEAEWAEHGITLLDVGIKTDASSTYSVNFEEWTSPTDGSPSTIETVATSASTEAEDDGALTDSAIAAGSIIYVDLPATDIDMLVVWGTYYVNEGD